MRFCWNCTAWFHVACLGAGTTAIDIEWDEDIDRLHPTQAGSYERPIANAEAWKRLVRYPIERTPRTDDGYGGEPFTGEAILQALRDRMAAVCAVSESPLALPYLTRLSEVLIQEEIEDPDARNRAEDLLEKIDGEPADTLWYGCPQCRWWI